MRFLENGDDIPNELIGSVTDGNAIFLCGAGVSFEAGMPLFRRLTEQVYEKLGESHDDEAAERKAFNRAEYDRACGRLKKGLIGQKQILVFEQPLPIYSKRAKALTCHIIAFFSSFREIATAVTGF